MRAMWDKTIIGESLACFTFARAAQVYEGEYARGATGLSINMKRFTSASATEASINKVKLP